MLDETITQAPVDPGVTRAQSDDERAHSAEHSASTIPIPGFRVHELLGHGGMGVVYRATQVKLHRTVALKMMLGGRAAGSKELIRFLAEVEAVAQIDHPHVVRIYESGDVDGKPYFAMEFLSGGSLGDRLKTNGRLPAKPCAELVRKLALAIQAAHDCQIVHRDLKPANVLFDSTGEPRITDFGLAKKGDAALTATNAIMGTPAYMAPEQARGESKFVGPQADIWALGVMLYECLTGAKPFAGSNEIEILRKVVDEEPSSLRSRVTAIPKDLELIAQKCLAKDPRVRYSSAKALAEDLRRWLSGEPVSVKAATTIERSVKWVRRNRLAASIMVASFLAVIFSGILAYFAIQQREAARTFAHRADAETENVIKANEDLQRQAKEQRYLLDVLRIKDALDGYEDGLTEFAQKTLEEVDPDDRTAIWHFARRRVHMPIVENDPGLSRILMKMKEPVQDLEWREGKVYAGDPYGNLSALTIQPRGILRATIDANGTTIAIHDPEAILRKLTGHEDEVTCIKWSPDGRFLASGSKDKTIRIWDIATGECLKAMQGKLAAVDLDWSPCGRTLAAARGNGIIRLWDVSTGQAVMELNGHVGAVKVVLFSPDGLSLLSGGEDGTVRIWQTKD